MNIWIRYYLSQNKLMRILIKLLKRQVYTLLMRLLRYIIKKLDINLKKWLISSFLFTYWYLWIRNINKKYNVNKYFDNVDKIGVIELESIRWVVYNVDNLFWLDIELYLIKKYIKKVLTICFKVDIVLLVRETRTKQTKQNKNFEN